jgi:hypothetical protein
MIAADSSIEPRAPKGSDLPGAGFSCMVPHFHELDE